MLGTLSRLESWKNHLQLHSNQGVSNRFTIAADLGGTFLRVGLVTPTGGLLNSKKFRLRGKSPEAVIAQLGEAIDVFDVAVDVPIGMGIPAEILPETGHVICAPNLGWNDVPFRTLAKTTLGRPIRLINDLNAITLGESRVGAAMGVDHLLCIYVGTGVGMGVISDGRLILGSHGFAGELGHFKVAPPGKGNRCGCGDLGCLEAYVSGRHLPRPAHDIESAFLSKDESAIQLWRECSRYLATAIINAATLMNPQMVVLGGGVLEAAPSLRHLIKETIRTFSNRMAIQTLEFKDAQCGDSAGVIGAGLYALGNGSGA